jgi:hypothetical protein
MKYKYNRKSSKGTFTKASRNWYIRTVPSGYPFLFSSNQYLYSRLFTREPSSTCLFSILGGNPDDGNVNNNFLFLFKAYFSIDLFLKSNRLSQHEDVDAPCRSHCVSCSHCTERRYVLRSGLPDFRRVAKCYRYQQHGNSTATSSSKYY